jgi:hypothetical protein
MSTRHIQTAGEQVACDVCGRTLLRGERAEVYLSGASRRNVCELCTTRALHEGWVREGTVPAFDASESSTDRRRSLKGGWARFRARRQGRSGGDSGDADRTAAPRRAERRAPKAPRAPVREPTVREPRHVRAVPTSAEHRVASAVDTFNGSEHCRTVSGVARSLGIPSVSVRPSDSRASVVNIVVSWELCWYRYEIDLSDEVPTVRVAGQGYELSELEPAEQEANAVADERGTVTLA